MTAPLVALALALATSAWPAPAAPAQTFDACMLGTAQEGAGAYTALMASASRLVYQCNVPRQSWLYLDCQILNWRVCNARYYGAGRPARDRQHAGAKPMNHDPDNKLRSLCSKAWIIRNMLRARKSKELVLDRAGVAAALDRYTDVLSFIAEMPAFTDRGRRAKIIAAHGAMADAGEPEKIHVALSKAALHDQVVGWDAADAADIEVVRLHRALVSQMRTMACIAATEATKQTHGITPETEAAEARADAAERERDAIVEQIAATPAHGVTGWRAKAAALLIVLQHLVCAQIGTTLADVATGEIGGSYLLALSLARDLAT